MHFDPPNDHKDYLHRSGRTARAGASGTVIALAEQAQVREIERLHDAAGVTPATHHVQAGHHVVRELATSGTPVVPAAVTACGRTARATAPASAAAQPGAAGRGALTRTGAGIAGPVAGYIKYEIPLSI